MENSGSYLITSDCKTCNLSHTRPSISITEVKKLRKNHHLRKLKKNCKYSRLAEKYLTQQDIPAWYRELSFEQMAAADSLQDAIIKDFQTGAIFRCQKAVINLRIYPIPNTANIKYVLKLSAGNDIMFLWTLLESFYKDSINTQILMSSICHLDMITTLREMDKIMPKTIHSKNYDNILKKNNIIILNESGVCTCPYLAPLPCPKPKNDSKLKHPSVLYTPDFSPYNKYLDKTHIVENESTRWFKSTIDTVVIDEETRCNKWNKMFAYCVCKRFSNLNSVCQELFKELKKENCHGSQLIMNVQAGPVDESNKLESEKNFKKTIQNLQLQVWKRVLIKNILENPSKLHKVKICEICEFHYKPNKEDCIKFLDSYKNATLIQHVYENIFFDDLVDKISLSGLETNLAFELEKLISNQEVVWVCLKDFLPLKFNTLKAKFIINKPNYKKLNRTEKYINKTMLNLMNQMKKNSKFVLVKLPESHKVPILREWMKVRLGLKYSINDKLAALRESKKIFDSIKSIRIPQLLPKINDISEKKIVSYYNKNVLIKKKEKLLNDFDRSLKENLLNDCRLFWQLMAPYHCSKDILKRNFYAYMPSSGNDILTFRIWKPYEYRNHHK